MIIRIFRIADYFMYCIEEYLFCFLFVCVFLVGADVFVCVYVNLRKR